jgi:hypothetical protein
MAIYGWIGTQGSHVKWTAKLGQHTFRRDRLATPPLHHGSSENLLGQACESVQAESRLEYVTHEEIHKRAKIVALLMRQIAPVLTHHDVESSLAVSNLTSLAMAMRSAAEEMF